MQEAQKPLGSNQGQGYEFSKFDATIRDEHQIESPSNGSTDTIYLHGLRRFLVTLRSVCCPPLSFTPERYRPLTCS